MSSKAETEAIWQNISGAQPLYKFYGFWPTLHDAVVRAVNIDFASRSLEITVDYHDMTETVNQEGFTGHRITLRWQGITGSKLRLYDGDLYGMDFTQRQEAIETRFEDYTWGMDGYIHSASVAVTKIEPTPDMSGLDQNDPAGHEIRIALA